jgi:hypothetical protein
VKILYAAGNRPGSFLQMQRFLQSVKNQNHIIKLAAYKSSMGNLFIDYTLDCLLNFTNTNSNISFNSNYNYYYNEIRRFAPNLIISDFEIYTSIIAIETNIKLWIASPVLLFYALNKKLKDEIGIYKNYSYLFNAKSTKKNYIRYLLHNSDKLFIISHLCDFNKRPELLPKYEWVRPEFILDCNHSISDGTETLLADAFYNQKYCISRPKYDDIESIICSFANAYYNLGANSFGESKHIDIKIDDDVKFLSEHLKSVDI